MQTADYREDTKLVWRMWRYFRQGHGVYLVFFISMLNFIVIQYRLLIEHVSLFRGFIPNLTLFAILFAVIYPAAAVLIGWKDMNKGSFPADSRINFDKNPRMRRMYEMVESIDRRLEKLERKKK
jgi:hypothetical protein